MLFSLLTNILLVIISLANCGYGSLAVSCTIQLLFGGCVCVLSQQIALSEFPMGRFLVPPQHATLSKIQMGRFLCNIPACCLVRITKGAIFCAKPCQNSQCGDSVCQTMSEFPVGWFCVPNHVRIPSGVILCAKPCQNSQWGDSVCWTVSEFPMGWFCVPNQHTILSKFPMGWFCVPNHVRIPNVVILCAKPCQNSQWSDSVYQTMSELPMWWFCVPNQHTALSELPMGWFCVPNHVRIPSGLCTLCTLN